MAKETRKQIVEQTRQEVAKQYKAKIADLEERLRRANNGMFSYMKEFGEQQIKINELQEKVNQYEDWIRRLQEYMDMPEDAREKALEQERAKFAVNSKLDSMLGVYSRIFNLF